MTHLHVILYLEMYEEVKTRATSLGTSKQPSIVHNPMQLMPLLESCHIWGALTGGSGHGLACIGAGGQHVCDTVALVEGQQFPGCARWLCTYPGG